MAANKEIEAIKARLKKEYRKVFDKDYDEKTGLDKNAKGKTGTRRKVRRRVQNAKAAKRAKGKTVRKSVLIL